MSGADTQSNPSDFDFADMQQETEDIEEVTVMVSRIFSRKKNMLNNNRRKLLFIFIFRSRIF